MTDPMDIDPRPMLDNTLWDDQGCRMSRARSADSIFQEEDLIEFPDPKQDSPVTVTHKALGDQSREQNTMNKEKMSWGQQISSFFGKSPSPLASQNEPSSTNDEDLRATLERKLKSIEKLKKVTKSTRKKMESTQRENEDMKRVNEAVAKENMSLQADVQTLENEKQDRDQKISRLEDEIRALTSTSDHLRQMLVPVFEKQVLDSDVVSRFINLRLSIVNLVRTTWKPVLKENVDFRKLSDSQKDFFGARVPVSYDRLRHLVFRGLYLLILGHKGYFLGGKFEDLEQHILAVDGELNRNSSAEGRQKAMEWRVATFKATESLRDNDHSLSFNTGRQIWNYLLPLQMKNATAAENGKKKLQAICDNAVELSLMLRQLQDDFKVDDLDYTLERPISKWSQLAEDMATVPAPTGAQSGAVAYVIFGALIKSPKEDLEKVLVLEKAEVAAYE